MTAHKTIPTAATPVATIPSSTAIAANTASAAAAAAAPPARHR